MVDTFTASLREILKKTLSPKALDNILPPTKSFSNPIFKRLLAQTPYETYLMEANSQKKFGTHD